MEIFSWFLSPFMTALFASKRRIGREKARKVPPTHWNLGVFFSCLLNTRRCIHNDRIGLSDGDCEEYKAFLIGTVSIRDGMSSSHVLQLPSQLLESWESMICISTQGQGNFNNEPRVTFLSWCQLRAACFEILSSFSFNGWLLWNGIVSYNELIFIYL